MDELQCITTGVMRVMACDNIIPPRPYTSKHQHEIKYLIDIYITRKMVPITR